MARSLLLIGLADVRAATERAIAELDMSFFRVRFDRLAPSEKRYLRAMAEPGPGPHRSGDVAQAMGREVQSVTPTRAKLIEKGMIHTARRTATPASRRRCSTATCGA